MIPAWLPVAVPWAGALLLAALPRRPVLAGPAVALVSLVAAAAFAGWGDAARPDALGAALLLAGAAAVLLFVVQDAGAAASEAPRRRDSRFGAAGFPLFQGAQAMALLAGDRGVAWLGLAIGAGAGAALVALPGGRRAFAAAWRMLLLCGAGSALALLGVTFLHGTAAEGPPALANLGFVLLLLGFGALAGLAPLGGWLPRMAAVAPPAVVALVAGLLPPAALHALLRAAGAAGPGSGVLPPAAALAAVGLATAGLAAVGAWRSSWRRPAAKELPGWGGTVLAGLAAVGFGIGGAAGALAGALLLLGLPFCVGAAVLGAGTGGPVAALGRFSLAGMPPFAPFAALVSLFTAVASLPAAIALPLGAALLAIAVVQLAAAGRVGSAASGAPRTASDRGAALLAGPAWVLLGLALVLGAALPEPVATALAGALAEVAR